MKEIRLLYYRKGFTLTDYNKYWDSKDLNLSGYIFLMKDVPTEKDKPHVVLLAKGWATWIKKCLKEYGLKIDIVIRALGHKELEYNPDKPMSIVASCLASEIGAEYRIDILKKIRSTESQTHLDYDRNRFRRERNVKNSISSTEVYSAIEGQNILVIDDIKTTGATLKEIGKALNKGLKNKIYFLTLGEPQEYPSKNEPLFNHLNQAMGIE